MSAWPSMAQIYVVGETVIAAILAGIGGLETAQLADSRLAEIVGGLLDRSEISSESFNREPVPAARTAGTKPSCAFSSASAR